MDDFDDDWFYLEDVAKWLGNKIRHSVKCQLNPENAKHWQRCLEAVMRAERKESFRVYKKEVDKDLQQLGFGK